MAHKVESHLTDPASRKAGGHRLLTDGLDPAATLPFLVVLCVS